MNIFALIREYAWLALCWVFGLNTLVPDPKDYKVMQQHLSCYTPYGVTNPLGENGDAIKIWMLIRDGTRYPSSSQGLNEIKNKIVNAKDVDAGIKKSFEKWSDADYGKEQLTPNGEKDMFEFGRRTRTSFPSIFDKPYTGEKYHFAVDASKTSKLSRQFFMEGLAAGIDVQNEAEFPPYSDSLVFTLPTDCQSMREAEQKNSQKIDFFDMDLWTKPAGAVERILRVTFDAKERRLIYKAFASEAAYKPDDEIPVWKSALNLEMVKIGDYLTDFVLEYKHGRREEENYKPLCLVLQEIEKYFGSEDATPKAKIYFTDNKMLYKFFAFLEMYVDANIEKPTLDAYDSPRQWKLSQIGGFGSNLAFALVESGGEKYIKMFHQEKVVKIPRCNDVLCKYADFQKIFQEELKCTRQQVC